MGKQMTEMLKGTLEGIVLAILAVRPAYGYEITARLREQGFSDIVEGTVYALLVRIEQRGFVDVEKVPSEKGPPRKVYSLNAPGGEYLEEFWRTWSFLAERIEQLHHHIEHQDARRRRVIMAAKWIEPSPARSRRRSGAPVQGPHRSRCPSRMPPPRRRCATSCTTAASPTATSSCTMFDDLADLMERAAVDGTPVRDDRRRRPGGVRRDLRAGLHRQAVDRQGARLAWSRRSRTRERARTERT